MLMALLLAAAYEMAAGKQVCAPANRRPRR